MTNTQSDFGMQYDSLADLVSFGMAPALVMYHWALVSMKLDGGPFGKIGWLVAFLYAACAALRLARFNSQVAQVDKRVFVGLASPAAAGLVASFVWTFHDLGWSGSELRYAALAVTVVAGLLMVSRVRYSSFKGSGDGPKAERVPFAAMVVAIAVLIALVIDPPKLLFTAAVLYALSGPVLWLRRRRAPAGRRDACGMPSSARCWVRWGTPCWCRLRRRRVTKRSTACRRAHRSSMADAGDAVSAACLAACAGAAAGIDDPRSGHRDIAQYIALPSLADAAHARRQARLWPRLRALRKTPPS